MRIDRLARSMKYLQDIVDELKEKGVSLKATQQPVDTGSAAGKAFLALLSPPATAIDAEIVACPGGGCGAHRPVFIVAGGGGFGSACLQSPKMHGRAKQTK